MKLKLKLINVKILSFGFTSGSKLAGKRFVGRQNASCREQQLRQLHSEVVRLPLDGRRGQKKVPRVAGGPTNATGYEEEVQLPDEPSDGLGLQEEVEKSSSERSSFNEPSERCDLNDLN
jgi:hypothetical protein